MTPMDDPFRTADAVLAGIKAKVIVVDFHAEATSEKVAMGWYLDGRVTAVLGTHTHIPTADERILHNGTAFQTDVGMRGPYDSVIGVETELVLHKFLTAMPGKFEAAKGNPKMCAALVTCDPTTGRASAIQRIMLGEYPPLRGAALWTSVFGVRQRNCTSLCAFPRWLNCRF